MVLKMNRREYLTKVSILAGSALLPSVSSAAMSTYSSDEASIKTLNEHSALGSADWIGLRKLFKLRPEYIHLATFLLFNQICSPIEYCLLLLL